jgi:alpha-L-arabinofuranosidase
VVVWRSSPAQKRDTVQDACLAHLVNDIAPIMTEAEAGLAAEHLLPIPACSHYARGTVQQTTVSSPDRQQGI